MGRCAHSAKGLRALRPGAQVEAGARWLTALALVVEGAVPADIFRHRAQSLTLYVDRAA